MYDLVVDITGVKMLNEKYQTIVLIRKKLLLNLEIFPQILFIHVLQDR